ncbi:MAG: proton-conducting transporter membrane subunit, partial [Candidatus Bathyarchaeia archaeon]
MEIPLVLQPILILLGAAMLIPLIDRLRKTIKVEKIRDTVAVLAFLFSFYSLLMLYSKIVKLGPQSYILKFYEVAFGGVQLFVDMLSVYMALIFCGLGFFVSIYSIRYMEEDTGLDKYYALLLTLVAGMIGVSFSGDFFNLYIFWEMMCISSYALVSFRKYTWEPIEAGFKYLVMSTTGSLIALYGISLLFGFTGTLNFQELSKSISSIGPKNLIYSYFVIAMIITGFGVTASIVPLHTWLPDAHPAAPSSISAMLSGVVIKTGVYAILRSLFTIFNPIYFDFGTILMILGVLTITVANFMALIQIDIKRLLAYSSTVNIGYIITSIGISAYALFHYYSINLTLAYAVALLALIGGLFHILNHAIGKGLLFLSSGCFIHETKTRDLTELEGIGKKMLLSGSSFSIGLLTLAGIPPLSGFWSKLFIIMAGLSILEDSFMKIITIIIILNSIFSASYYIWLIQRIMVKEPKPKAKEAIEAPLTMVIPIIILAILCIFIGILP